MMDLFGILVYANVNVINHVMLENRFRIGFRFRKRLIDKLVEECSEDINRNEMICNVTLHDHGKVCNSCTIYIALLIITFVILMSIDSVYIYFYWHTIKDCFNKLPY